MIRDLLVNEIFLTLVLVWLVVALVKYIIALTHGEKAHFGKELLITGGMPSGHSAGVSSLATIIGLQQGFSALFFVVVLFGILVIRDSFGVRYSVGQQAQVLNKLIKHDHMHDEVRVVAGHTPLQTVIGILVGVVIAILVYFLV